jgi:3-phenylpropionate/trans-cinnamate dioxygenase ferredoxin reductase subunit
LHPEDWRKNLTDRIIIVGAGHAGGSVAAMLRQNGHTGEITLIGDEAHIPYQRPPLSKAYLTGEAGLETLELRAENFYHEQRIVLQLGSRACSIDRARQVVTLEGGATSNYHLVIIATGSRARPLPVSGIGLQGIHELRNIADADALIDALQSGRRLVVIGGGYIGLEVAASARALGAEVTLVEREPRILARVACEHLSRFFEDYHRARGVVMETNAGVAAIEAGEGGWVGAVALTDGRKIPCDSVLIGVGGIPCSELALAAGLACENGIVVDEDGRTSDPNIFAIGDVTWRPMPLYGSRRFRLESVQNALEQAKQCSAAITGRPRPAREVPWFWSDQYDLKLQIAGVPFDADRQVVRTIDQNKFAIFHLQTDLVRAVEAVNAPMEFMQARKWIGAAQRVDPLRLVDASVSMKELAAQT